MTLLGQAVFRDWRTGPIGIRVVRTDKRLAT